MRPFRLNYSPAAEDLDGYANDVNSLAGVALTLAATTAGDGLAHLAIITPSGAVTGDYALTGTDADGKAQTETLATDGANAVTSAKYWKTLTQVLAPSGIGAETVDIGWTEVAVGPTIPLNWRAADPTLGLGFVITGVIVCGLQYCLDDIRSAAPSTLKWWDHGVLVAISADLSSDHLIPSSALRLSVTSLDAGATVGLEVTQGAFA